MRLDTTSLFASEVGKFYLPDYYYGVTITSFIGPAVGVRHMAHTSLSSELKTLGDGKIIPEADVNLLDHDDYFKIACSRLSPSRTTSFQTKEAPVNEIC